MHGDRIVKLRGDELQSINRGANIAFTFREQLQRDSINANAFTIANLCKDKNVNMNDWQMMHGPGRDDRPDASNPSMASQALAPISAALSTRTNTCLTTISYMLIDDLHIIAYADDRPANRRSTGDHVANVRDRRGGRAVDLVKHETTRSTLQHTRDSFHENAVG
jgi:hypothetical protein